MPTIFDFDCTLTIAHTFSSYAIERVLTSENQYALGQEQGKKNIKRGIDSVLKHDEHDLSAVATYHNNPEFVAGNISAILKKELTFEASRKIIVNASLERTEIAINIYKVAGIDKPFLISYLPSEHKEFQSAMRILGNKNDQISAIREFWLEKGFIKSTGNIDFYEDSFINFYDAKSLDYINGHLVTGAGKEHIVKKSYQAAIKPLEASPGLSSPPASSPLHQKTEETNALSKNNISMMVLGGFIAATGIAAIAIAFTVLNAATFGVPGLLLAGAGIVATLTGCGLFAFNIRKQTTLNTLDSSMHKVKA